MASHNLFLFNHIFATDYAFSIIETNNTLSLKGKEVAIRDGDERNGECRGEQKGETNISWILRRDGEEDKNDEGA